MSAPFSPTPLPSPSLSSSPMAGASPSVAAVAVAVRSRRRRRRRRPHPHHRFSGEIQGCENRFFVHGIQKKRWEKRHPRNPENIKTASGRILEKRKNAPKISRRSGALGRTSPHCAMRHILRRASGHFPPIAGPPGLSTAPAATPRNSGRCGYFTHSRVLSTLRGAPQGAPPQFFIQTNRIGLGL